MPILMTVQLAQTPAEGWDWSNLLYLALFIIIPIVNAIKDKFVQRANAKREEQAEAMPTRPGRVPKLRPIDPTMAVAKPLRPPPGPAQAGAPAPPPQARPAAAQPVAKQAAPAQARRPATTARLPKPPPAGQVQPPPPPPQVVKPAARAPQPAEDQQRRDEARRRRVEARAAQAKRQAVAGVDVETAAPRVKVKDADPHVNVHKAAPAVKVSRRRPAVDVHGLVTAEIDDEVATGWDILGGQLSPAELRRAVVLSEILRPPLAVRGPGGMTPGTL